MVMVIFLFIVAVSFFFSAGGFNDFIEHYRKVKKARSGWENKKDKF